VGRELVVHLHPVHLLRPERRERQQDLCLPLDHLADALICSYRRWMQIPGSFRKLGEGERRLGDLGDQTEYLLARTGVFYSLHPCQPL
jgi:hypothetical protein